MATHGAMSEFNPGGKESWSTYTERLEHYFAANGVTEAAQKRAILLTVCGATTYRLIKSLTDTESFKTTTYEGFTKLVMDYYEPTPSPIVQRYKFNSRSRAPNESIAAYIAALRELAEHCKYGTSLPEMLRDRLVCGVNHEGIQKKLLSVKDLTYDSAYSLALAIEAAEQDAVTFKSGAAGANTHQQVLFNRHKGSTPTTTTPNSAGAHDARKISCYRCGGSHLAPTCRFKDTECGYCKKKGHLARVCRARKSKSDVKPKENLFVSDAAEEQQDGTYDLYTIHDQANEPTRLKVFLNDVPVDMIMDTGASLSIISRSTFDRIKDHSPSITLTPSLVRLQTYTGELLPVVGSTQLSVRYESTVCKLSVQVVSGVGPDLMGRDWLKRLEVTSGQVNLVEHDKLKEVLLKHEAVFDGSLGCMEDVEVTIQVDPKIKPKFLKPRSVPFVLKEKVEKELDRLENLKIISPVQQSQWAAPIVPVTKRDGSLRICGDFKTTVNQASRTETYPLPRVDELFANLSGGKHFTKLDLSNAYLQLPLAEESKQYVCINTHKGLFQYNRLPFGVASAPAIFQRTMENLFRGLKGVSVYIDDILVTGATIEEHLQTLGAVLERLEKAGLRLNRAKCAFLQPSIEYLGHVIDEKGLHPTDEKISALREAPTPKNATQLRSFLGIINYYSKFLPNLSGQLSPLYSLLCKHKKWVWGAEQEAAFKVAKNALQSDAVLVHYDSTKPLVLACDASEYGVGAVLSHIMEDGQEKPIAFTSRTLNAAERRYSQLEREGLAIVFGVKKFHNYVYGRRFMIESDHQPLSYLFSETRVYQPWRHREFNDGHLHWQLTSTASDTSRGKP